VSAAEKQSTTAINNLSGLTEVISVASQPTLSPEERQRFLLESAERIMGLLGIDSLGVGPSGRAGSRRRASRNNGIDIYRTAQSNLEPSGTASVNSSEQVVPIYSRIFTYTESYYASIQKRFGRVALEKTPDLIVSIYAIENFHGDPQQPKSLKEIRADVIPSQVPTIETPIDSENGLAILAMENFAVDLSAIAEGLQTRLS